MEKTPPKRHLEKSWLQLQMEKRGSRMVGNHAVQTALYAEWMSPKPPEKNLLALRYLACTPESRTPLRQAHLDELLIAPREDEVAEAEELADAVISMAAFNQDLEYPGRMNAFAAVRSVARILKPRWRGTCSDQSIRFQAESVAYISSNEEDVLPVLEKERQTILIALVEQLKQAVKEGTDTAQDLGFSEALDREDLATLRNLAGELGHCLAAPGWKVTMAPFMEVMGFLTPERLLELGRLVGDYNWPWAVASMDWS